MFSGINLLLNFTFANPFVLEYQQKFKSFSVAPGVNTILPESMLPTQKSTSKKAPKLPKNSFSRQSEAFLL